MKRFRDHLRASPRVVVLTGAGVSAESGIPTFRGAGGLWRSYRATDLATPEAFARDPVLVWEFYDYRREMMGDKRPNAAHRALAELEARWAAARGRVDVVTQNIDGLHAEAGSRNITRLHGSLWHVRCTGCGEVSANREVGLAAGGLPVCRVCGGVLRPHVVWFGEALEPENLEAALKATLSATTLLVVGTSAMVQPAAGLIPLAKENGAVVAEVNLEPTPATALCDFFFAAKAGEVLPGLLDVQLDR